MSLRRTTLHENARSALECCSEAAALKSEQKAVADATALQGAFGTAIFMAGRHNSQRAPAAPRAPIKAERIN
jgi:hypothetical protein